MEEGDKMPWMTKDKDGNLVDGYGMRESIMNASAPLSEVDYLIKRLEDLGLGWSLDHTSRLIEARVWDWPDVIGRYRPNSVEPLAKMLLMAMIDAGL